MSKEEYPEGTTSPREASEEQIKLDERMKEFRKNMHFIIGGLFIAVGFIIVIGILFTLKIIPASITVGALIALSGAISIVTGKYTYPVRKKYCEVEIIQSNCHQAGLRVGNHLCMPCPKDGRCPEEDREITMWDLPPGTTLAKEEDPHCQITIHHLTKQSKYITEHPIVNPVPVKKEERS